MTPHHELAARFRALVDCLASGNGTDDTEALALLRTTAELSPLIREFAGTACVLERMNEPCVYLLVKGGRVVYVGQSLWPLERVASHSAKRRFQFDAVWFITVPRAELNAMECALIARFLPAENRSPGPKTESLKPV